MKIKSASGVGRPKFKQMGRVKNKFSKVGYAGKTIRAMNKKFSRKS